MALIAFLILNGAIVFGIWNWFRSRGRPKDENITAPIKQDWCENILGSITFMGIMAFGWGVLSGETLSMTVTLPWGEMETWQLGGIISIPALLLWDYYKKANDKKRMSKRLQNPPSK